MWTCVHWLHLWVSVVVTELYIENSVVVGREVTTTTTCPAKTSEGRRSHWSTQEQKMSHPEVIIESSSGDVKSVSETHTRSSKAGSDVCCVSDEGCKVYEVRQYCWLKVVPTCGFWEVSVLESGSSLGLSSSLCSVSVFPATVLSSSCFGIRWASGDMTRTWGKVLNHVTVFNLYIYQCETKN